MVGSGASHASGRWNVQRSLGFTAPGTDSRALCTSRPASPPQPLGQQMHDAHRHGACPPGQHRVQDSVTPRVADTVGHHEHRASTGRVEQLPRIPWRRTRAFHRAARAHRARGRAARTVIPRNAPSCSSSATNAVSRLRHSAMDGELSRTSVRSSHRSYLERVIGHQMPVSIARSAVATSSRTRSSSRRADDLPLQRPQRTEDNPATPATRFPWSRRPSPVSTRNSGRGRTAAGARSGSDARAVVRRTGGGSGMSRAPSTAGVVERRQLPSGAGTGSSCRRGRHRNRPGRESAGRPAGSMRRPTTRCPPHRST